MKRTTTRLLVLTALATVACGRPTATAPDVVARLGEEDLTYADFEEYLRVNSLDSEIGLASPVLSGLFDQFLFEELVLATAREEGIEGVDRRRVVEALVSSRVAAEVGEDDIADYYAKHPQEFALEERVSLLQILVNDRATAAAALARLRAGEPFESVARSVQASDDPGGWRQADLARENVPPHFADTIFSLAVGEVSEIVEAEYGFLIFQVTAHQPSETLSLEAARPEIRHKLERTAADRALAAVVSEATQRYNVAVFEQNLPFDYQGTYRRKPAH